MLVAIVDDSPQDAQRLEAYLRRYGEETGGEYRTTLYPSAVDFLQCRDTAFDLIIMDIDMPGINGVDAARRLRERGDGTVLMFVTNMPQYALAGYEVEAVDYVLKPVAYQDFALKLRKARRYMSTPFQNVDFRRNGMSFFTGQHTGVIQPYTPHHLPV